MGLEFKYIILDNVKKTPTHKLRDGGFDFEEVQYADNLAVFVPEPYVVIDVDDMEQAFLLKKILDDKGIKTMIQQTDRGMHFWFKNEKPLTNVVDAKSAIGIRVDIRSHGKISYVVVKKDGFLRNWISNTSDVPQLPKWLLPVVSQYDFYKMGAGEGRNNGLYAYILVLQELGYKKEEVLETLNIINDYILKEPVSDDEFKTITRDEAFKPDDTVKYSKAVVDGKVQHHLLADLLIEEFRIITANGQMYMYVDGYYKKGEVYILQRVLDAFPSVKKSFRNEIIEYIKIQSFYDMGKHKESVYYLNLSNGRLDVLNGKLYQHDPNIVEFVRVPVVFDPEAYDKHVDNMLNKLFVNDIEVRLLFEEMIGYALTRNQKYQRGFMFYGDGSNGKSTMLEMIRRFFGNENVTSVDLGRLSENYAGAELENKLVNIGDDINTRVLRDTGDIKKLFTGEGMLVRPIYQEPFMLHSFAKMIFSANELPHSTDKSYGFLRRFEFIPLEATIKATDPDFDPHILDKITTDNAKSYLLNIAISGLKRLIRQGDFTKPKSVERAKEQYRISNSSVLTWVNDTGVTYETLSEGIIADHYQIFKEYTINSGQKHVPSRTTFTQEINREFGTESIPTKIDGRTQRAFRTKE